MLLDSVSSVQQSASISAQLPGQMEGGRPLNDAAHNLDDLGAGIAGLLPLRPGEEVEDLPARFALVVQDGGAVTIVCPRPSRKRMPCGTVKALRVEAGQEEVVACLLVQQIADRETDHGAPSFRKPQLADLFQAPKRLSAGRRATLNAT